MRQPNNQHIGGTNMKKLFITLLITLLAFAANAQKSSVSGTVVNGQTGHPIAGANVSAVGENIAVVTNSDGYFTLKTDQTPKGIRVSHVGFQTHVIHPTAEGLAGDLVIRLRPAAIMLKEVVVTNENARRLVENAISKIPDNYSTHPELLKGFYRETAMKRQHFIYVAEGVIDMYKTSYTRQAYQDRVAIRKGRRLLSPRQGDTLGVKVMGGPVQPIQLDIAKNRDFLLNNEDLDCYAFSMASPQSIDGRLQHVVRMEPSANMPYALYHGLLYIDQETLAFTRAELSLDMSDKDKATRYMLIKKPLGVKFKPKEMSLLIDYKQDNGVTRISYIRNVFKFNCDWKRRLLATSFTATCEMVVTDVQTSNSTNGKDGDSTVHPIKGRDSFDSRDMFFDKVEYFKDPHFWEDYNIIEPTESLDKAINRLLKRF